MSSSCRDTRIASVSTKTQTQSRSAPLIDVITLNTDLEQVVAVDREGSTTNKMRLCQYKLCRLFKMIKQLYLLFWVHTGWLKFATSEKTCAEFSEVQYRKRLLNCNTRKVSLSGMVSRRTSLKPSLLCHCCAGVLALSRAVMQQP